ncbi:hypothetical protein NDU88_000792 [Pleurodeles waltl]|uniref:Uncharacterized protein n=1 Tax=Pleurodeles waltl TaxID=8319 RepID=A0AAV7WGI1_PLEWA|nr:hypothetical protein NDU88_000792 [Pleurodeles waltl]
MPGESSSSRCGVPIAVQRREYRVPFVPPCMRFGPRRSEGGAVAPARHPTAVRCDFSGAGPRRGGGRPLCFQRSLRAGFIGGAFWSTGLGPYLLVRGGPHRHSSPTRSNAASFGLFGSAVLGLDEGGRPLSLPLISHAVLRRLLRLSRSSVGLTTGV